MQISQVVTEIDAEISRLQEARRLLMGGKDGATHPFAFTGRKHHRLSREARERIAAAQRKRWAAVKKAAK